MDGYTGPPTSVLETNKQNGNNFELQDFSLQNIALYYHIIYKCSAVAEMSNRLATIDMGRKLGAVPL